MKTQIIKLVFYKDYKVWCNGRLVVIRNFENRLVFYKKTDDVKREFRIGKDELVGIRLVGN